MLIRKLIYSVLLCSLMGCSNQTDTGQKSFQGIPAEAGSNAAIVRNPVQADGQQDTVNVARIEFAEETYDFGTIEQGTTVSHEFRFRNTGKVPLLISDARSTCGCTVPKVPQQPIPPGEEGAILVRFDSEHKIGQQNKPITITANTYPAISDVFLTGTVVKNDLDQ